MCQPRILDLGLLMGMLARTKMAVVLRERQDLLQNGTGDRVVVRDGWIASSQPVVFTSVTPKIFDVLISHFNVRLMVEPDLPGSYFNGPLAQIKNQFLK